MIFLFFNCHFCKSRFRTEFLYSSKSKGFLCIVKFCNLMVWFTENDCQRIRINLSDFPEILSGSLTRRILHFFLIIIFKVPLLMLRLLLNVLLIAFLKKWEFEKTQSKIRNITIFKNFIFHFNLLFN